MQNYILRYHTRFFKYVFFGVLILMALYSLLNSTYGIENSALMYAFDADEPREVIKVINNIQTNTLNPKEFHYGYLLHTIVFWIAKFFTSALGHAVSIKMIAFIFRIVSLISFVAGILLIVKIIRNFTGNDKIAYFSGLFLASAPDIFFWSQRVHPDTLQLALVIAALLILIKTHNIRFLILASILAGLAFGTKYSGLFILPFISIPYILKAYAEKGKLPIISSIKAYTISVISFFAAWLAANPYSIEMWNKLKEDFLFEKANITYGHVLKADPNGFLWFPQITSQFTFIGSILLGIGMLYWIYFVFKNIKHHGKKLFIDAKIRFIITLLFYTFSSFIYLMLEVNERVPRHLFHILPAFLILGVTGIYKLLEIHLQRTRFQKALAGIFILLIFISSIALDVSALAGINDSEKLNGPKIQAGSFLLDQGYNKSINIVGDNYSYIPEDFVNTIKVYAIDYSVIQQYNPHIIVLNKSSNSIFSWKKEGTSFKEGILIMGNAPTAEHYYEFHKKLFSDQNWIIVYESEEAVILESKNPPQLSFIPKSFSLEGFFEDHTWTKGKSSIMGINYRLYKADKFFVLKTNGWYPYKNDLKKLGLRVFIDSFELKFEKVHENNYYFQIDGKIEKVNEITIISNTFSPKEAGINDDTRQLGIDIKSFSFAQDLPQT